MESGTYNGHDFVVNYAQHEVGHVQNTEEWVDPEVQAELEAMNPGQRFGSSSAVAGFMSKKPVMSSRLVKPIAQRSTPPPRGKLA